MTWTYKIQEGHFGILGNMEHEVGVTRIRAAPGWRELANRQPSQDITKGGIVDLPTQGGIKVDAAAGARGLVAAAIITSQRHSITTRPHT